MTLAATSSDSLIGLQTLAVMSTWVNLIAYAQVPRLCLDGKMADLLAEAGEPGSLGTVRTASAATLDSLDGAFQDWMCSLLEDEVQTYFGTSDLDEHDAAVFLTKTSPKKKLSGGVTRTSGELLEVFSIWRMDHDVKPALARTLQDSLTDAMGNKAKEWFAAVGRHCGFVGPRRGHPARLRVEVALAPALLLAGMDDGDAEVIPFSVWLERMSHRYGLLFGPSTRARSMAPRASEEDLRRNESDLASLFASLGLARRYSDGVTELLNPFYVWAKK
ncbi:hypothetical protein ACQPWR_05530 [Micromonospora vinacea]|uniref:hypothetical protein n=1 Tax=Micromonospora vinacea TaxID=709878 RepID=UPI003D90B153